MNSVPDEQEEPPVDEVELANQQRMADAVARKLWPVRTNEDQSLPSVPPAPL